MGRNILRRSSLTTLFLFTGLWQICGASAGLNPPENRHSLPSASEGARKNPPREDHRRINFWSVQVHSRPLIDQYIDYFGQGSGLEYLNRSLTRAEPFWDFIAARIREKDLPPELIYLPLIESAYRIDAVSRSGAAGLWQFMMNSIDPYDITVDSWRDDRRDFWRATEGALDKLEYNYERTGDWLLALAAYNCGLNKVLRTIKATGISDYWELSEKGLLPRETRHYIPKLAAVVYLSQSKASAGIPLNWAEPMDWKRIPLSRSVDIRRVARKAEVPEEILLLAHGELHYGVTPPPRSAYYLKTPRRYSQKIESVLAEESELISFKRYKIQSGDTLSEIADWYDIPVSYILEYNPGVRSRYLRIGQILLVPLVDDTIPDRPGSLSGETGAGWTGEYTVQPGDTLWGIASRHGVSPEEIAAGNKLPLESTILPGMRLIVPGPGE